MADNEATLIVRIKQAGANVLDSITEKFGSLKNVALAAFTAMAAVMGKALMDYREQELAINALSQSMVNAGVFTSALRDRYLEQAAALQKLTTFGDEQIIKAQAILQQHLGNIEITKELTMATLDLATKTGSLDSAADMVGKTIGSTTNALARQGIEVDANAEKHEKLGQVIEGLNAKVGGQAIAAADGLGVWAQLGNAASDMSEKLGEELSPTFVVIGKTMLDFLNNSLMPTAAFISDVFGKAINGITQILLGAGFVVETFGAQLGNVFGAVAQAALAIAEGDFKKLKDVATNSFDQIGQTQVELTEKYGARLSALRQSFFDDNEAQRQADLEKEKLANEKNLELLQEKLLKEQLVKQQQRVAEQEMEIAQIGASDEQKLQQQINAKNKEIAAATDASVRLGLLKDKEALLDQQRAMRTKAYEDQINAQRIKGYGMFFEGMASLSESGNKELAAIGKAAAIAKATMDAYVAIQNALASMPYPANIAAAVGIGVMAFSNVSKIAGVKLAEGGIVQATPGGVPAIIGEGGKDEAVIPLDDDGAMNRLGGGGTTIIFQGPTLGDEQQAMEFAKNIDRALFRLRQSNQSLAFDEDLV
jgi:hypothetical protein